MYISVSLEILEFGSDSEGRKPAAADQRENRPETAEKVLSARRTWYRFAPPYADLYSAFETGDLQAQ